jgi:hypothetical protein
VKLLAIAEHKQGIETEMEVEKRQQENAKILESVEYQ